MKVEDFKIQIIDNGGNYTAFLNHKDFTGLVVQVESLEDIPKQLSLSFEAMLQYSMENNNYEITNWEEV